VDGGTVVDVFTDVDLSQTTIVINGKQYATAPSSGVAWTIAQVNAIKVRWGSSWTAVDIAPVPFIDGLLCEVDYAPSSFPFSRSDRRIVPVI
jgi:hypothetical protein